MRNVVSKQNADSKDIEECLAGMREAAPDWRVAGYEKYMARFEAVDAKDRHVAAAAYKLTLEEWPGQDVVRVTSNLKDFPEKAFEDTLVSVISPGAYVDCLYAALPERVIRGAEGCRKKLRNPPVSAEQYVAMLMKHRCVKLAQALAVKWNVECPAIASDGSLYYASEVEVAKKEKQRPKNKKSTRSAS
jgi:hypothetical protein